MRLLVKVFLKLLPLLVTICLVIGFHQIGTKERGYSAIGGEVLFVVVAPLWYSIAHDERRYKKQKQKTEAKQDVQRHRTQGSCEDTENRRRSGREQLSGISVYRRL